MSEHFPEIAEITDKKIPYFQVYSNMLKYMCKIMKSASKKEQEYTIKLQSKLLRLIKLI